MKALLLSAGLGTRARPLTDFLPKCLLPILGKPLIDYWLDLLCASEVDEVLINLHYKQDLVIEHLQHYSKKIRITWVEEPELLLTGGTLLKNKSFFSDEPFLLIHGDNLCFCDLISFINAHKNRSTGCDITMMLFTSPDPKSCGIVELDQWGVVQHFHEKVLHPPSNLANAAVYIMEPQIIDFLRKLNKERIDLSTEVLPQYLGKIQTWKNIFYHRDIGTVESFALAQIEAQAFLTQHPKYANIFNVASSGNRGN